MNIDTQLFSNALIKHFLLIAIFDKKTHKCTWIKSHGEFFEQEKIYDEGSYFFYELSSFVHPNDLSILEKYVGNDKIYTINSSITILHMKHENEYRPYYVEFTNEDDKVYFTIRNADSKTAALDDALFGFEKTLIKIIKVDYDNNTFQDIKVFEEEKPVMKGFEEWFDMFVDNYVFETDREQLKKFMTKENVYNTLKTKNHMTFSYRRWYKNKWIIAMIHIIPCPNFALNKNEIMVYISKIS